MWDNIIGVAGLLYYWCRIIQYHRSCTATGVGDKITGSGATGVWENIIGVVRATGCVIIPQVQQGDRGAR